MNNAFPVSVFNPVPFWREAILWHGLLKQKIGLANSSFQGVALGWGGVDTLGSTLPSPKKS